MKVPEVLRWNTRFAGMYAFGVWAMIGSYAVLTYLRPDLMSRQATPKEEEEVDDQQYTVVTQNSYFKTVTVYKKDFVPYHTRVYNFFMGEPGSGDK